MAGAEAHGRRKEMSPFDRAVASVCTRWLRPAAETLHRQLERSSGWRFARERLLLPLWGWLLSSRAAARLRGAAQLRVLLLCGLCGWLTGSLREVGPGDAGVDGAGAGTDGGRREIAALLGGLVAGEVRAGELVWAQSGGVVLDWLLGRGVVFAAATGEGGARDIFRARVRLTHDGRPIAARAAYNLTRTSIGDDLGLTAGAGRVAFATAAYGQLQGITLLNLRGIAPEDEPSSPLDRLLLGVSSLQQTGSWAGVGRTDLVLSEGAAGVALRFDEGSLELALGGAGGVYRYDPESRALSSGDDPSVAASASPAVGAGPVGVRHEVHHPKPMILWAVDTVRAEVGPEPIAWLEQKVFGLRDLLRRAHYLLGGEEDELAVATSVEQVVQNGEPEPTDDADEAAWPPPALATPWARPRPGEGAWKPVTHPWLAPLPGSDGKAPPYFYQTFLRPEPDRPYAELHVIAMDMRQLELRMEAGYEDPRPLTGPAGSGHIPKDPKLVRRVVATFNGAFKTTHGEYGMMVDRRVLLPPVAGGATIVTTQDGEVGFGSWPVDTSIPSDLRSFRQNLDPLVADGVANPAGRRVWGWELAGQSVLTERTALCVTRRHHVYYVWARESSGPSFARALAKIGCDYAVHLDMNPKHCAFIYASVEDIDAQRMSLALAHPDMSVTPNRYVLWSPKDFFYVLVREPPFAAASGTTWIRDRGRQPEPRWAPGVFVAHVTVGTLPVRLLGIARGRAQWVVRAGSAEPTTEGARPRKTLLEPRLASRRLLSLGLGHATQASRYGMAFAGEASLRLRPEYATLVLSRLGRPRVILPTGALDLGGDDEAVQLELLARQGAAMPVARERGAKRARAALCVTTAGDVIVAEVRHDSVGPAVLALLDQGCETVVGLDRGSHHEASLLRAGVDEEPGVETQEQSLLHASGLGLAPSAFLWPELDAHATNAAVSAEAR